MQLITKTGSENAANAVIRLNPLDDVLIARQPIPKGLILESEGLTALDAIPSGHKIATRDLQAGQALRRYGQIIGFASQPIKAGEHVHVHNLAMGIFRAITPGVDARGFIRPTRTPLWASCARMAASLPVTTWAS
jgi:altronate hydrolase